MADASLVVVFKGEATSLINDFRKISAEAGLAGEKTELSFAKAGKAIALAGAAIATTAIAIGAVTVKMASEFEDAQIRMVTAIKDTGGSFKEFEPQVDAVNKKMEDLGFSNTKVEGSLSPLIIATHSTTKALSLMPLAADIARGRNIDLAAATNILVKVVTGHVALLGRLGLATKDATGKTISQRQAIEELSQYYGGQAQAYTEGLTGKTEVLKAKLQDLAVKIGTVLIPILEKVASFVVGKIVPAFQALGGWIEKNQTFVVVFSAVLGGVGVAALVAYAAQLAVVAVEAGVALGPIALLVGAVVGLGAAAQAMGITWQDVWNTMGTQAANAASAITRIVHDLAQAINGTIAAINVPLGSLKNIPVIGKHLPTIQIPTISVPGTSPFSFSPVSTDGGGGYVAPVGAGYLSTPGGATLGPSAPVGFGGVPPLDLGNFSNVGGGGKGGSGSSANTKAAKIADQFAITLSLLTPNVTYFEKQLEQTIHGVSRSSSEAQAAALNFAQAKETVIKSNLDLSDTRRNLALAKVDQPLGRFAVLDAQAQLAKDMAVGSGADAETIAKDQIAIQEAIINASKSTEDITRAQLNLKDVRLTEIDNVHKLTIAHTELNHVLHGFPKNSVEVFNAMGQLAKAISGVLGVPGSAQRGRGGEVTINIQGHVIGIDKFQKLIVDALREESRKNGSVKGVRTSG